MDNLQSGAEAGSPLAQEMGASYVELSNFPGFRNNVPDYEALLKDTIDTLCAALD